jgi:hypothetical protein
MDRGKIAIGLEGVDGSRYRKMSLIWTEEPKGKLPKNSARLYDN